MTSRPTDTGFRPIRRDQLRQERVHDTYKLQGKLAEPAACSECGAIYHAGRWQWAPAAAEAERVICPACQRIRDRFPVGFVEAGGSFFAEHREEALALLRHREAKEKAEHPLARIIGIEEGAEGIMVTTTDIHLARDLGEALHHAFQGELEFHYNEAQNLLRVRWSR